jgi:transposase
VGRRPGVFVRPVSMEEGRRLQRISPTAKDPVKLRRAIVMMMSAQGQSVPDVPSLMQVSAGCVRDVIHAFNERGFDALDPKWSGGRPRTIGSQVREHICLIARTSPSDWKITSLSTWSLTKPADHLVKQQVVPAVSRETLRRPVEVERGQNRTDAWSTQRRRGPRPRPQETPSLVDWLTAD